MKYFIFLPALFVALILNGCASYKGDPLAQMTFDHVKPFSLYVASYEPINIHEGVRQRLPEGFVTNPIDLIYDYLGSRFEAVGNQGKLKIEISSVTINYSVAESSNSVGSLIGLGKRDHYHVKANVDIIGLGIGHSEFKKQSLVLSRNIYISEHVSLVERERLQMQALDSMIDDLDIALRRVLKDQFNVMR